MTKSVHVGQLILRVGLGGAIAAHGAQKLFGWFGGGGLEGTGQFFESVGLAPGKRWATLSALGEAGGGAALALGLATPAAGAAVAVNMGVAASQHTSNGFFNTEGGFEYPAALGLAGLSFAISGPGAYSLDRALGGVFTKPWMRVAAVLAIAPATVAIVMMQKRAQQRAAANAPAAETPADETPADETPADETPADETAAADDATSHPSPDAI